MNELEPTIRRYLLGELSESEQSALEERYFTDPQIFNEVLKTESELVDGFVRGQLSNEVRERFEQSYLDHPARSERVKFAAALATTLDQTKQPVTSREQLTLPVSWWQSLIASFRGQRPTLQFSMALATLVLMLGGVWLFVESRRRQQRSQLAQTEAAREAEQRRQREQSQQTADQGRRAGESGAQQAAAGSNPQLPPPKPTPTLETASRSVSLALMVGGVRGGDSNQVPTLVIRPGTTQARLLLNLKENNYPSYQASLQTVAGVEVFSQRGIKPGRAKSGASFVFTVPADKLAAGDYVLTLRGINPDGEVDDLSKSLFRVEKK